MKTRLTYAEKLRDPRWQRRRLEVMERAGFKCESCDSSTNTLNVHHKRYIKNRQPWEYEDKYLLCLCEGCHEHCERLKAGLDDALSSITPRAYEESLVALAGIVRLWGTEEIGQLLTAAYLKGFGDGQENPKGIPCIPFTLGPLTAAAFTEPRLYVLYDYAARCWAKEEKEKESAVA